MLLWYKTNKLSPFSITTSRFFSYSPFFSFSTGINLTWSRLATRSLASLHCCSSHNIIIELMRSFFVLWSIIKKVLCEGFRCLNEMFSNKLFNSYRHFFILHCWCYMYWLQHKCERELDEGFFISFERNPFFHSINFNCFGECFA